MGCGLGTSPGTLGRPVEGATGGADWDGLGETSRVVVRLLPAASILGEIDVTRTAFVADSGPAAGDPDGGAPCELEAAVSRAARTVASLVRLDGGGSGMGSRRLVLRFIVDSGGNSMFQV